MSPYCLDCDESGVMVTVIWSIVKVSVPVPWWVPLTNVAVTVYVPASVGLVDELYVVPSANVPV